MTVCFRPTLSPIYPNNKAPIGFSAKVEQKVNADKRELVNGSTFGKNNSFNTTAICTNNMRSKYSKNVPICKRNIASFCSLFNLGIINTTKASI